MSPVTRDTFPPWGRMWKLMLLLDSPNSTVTLRGSVRGCLNQAVMFTGAVMNFTPAGTKQPWEDRTQTSGSLYWDHTERGDQASLGDYSKRWFRNIDANTADQPSWNIWGSKYRIPLCFSISAKQTDSIQRLGEVKPRSLAGRERSRRGEYCEKAQRPGRSALLGTLSSTRFTSSGSGSSDNSQT